MIRARDKATSPMFPFKVPKNRKGRAYVYKYYELRDAEGGRCVQCSMPVDGKGLFILEALCLIGPACRPECLAKHLSLDKKTTRLRMGGK